MWNAGYYHFHYQSYCETIGLEIYIFDRSDADTSKSIDSTYSRYRLIGTPPLTSIAFIVPPIC